MKKVPNILSLIRLALCPLLIVVFFSTTKMYFSFIVFFVACSLDVIDGYIARKYDAVTDVGKLLDPLADKMLQVSAAVCLVINGLLPVIVVIVIAAKELLMVVGGAFLLKKKKRVVSSNVYGKIAALAFNASVCAMFFLDTLFAGETAKTIIYVALYSSVALGVISLVQYGIINYINPYVLKKDNNE